MRMCNIIFKDFKQLKLALEKNRIGNDYKEHYFIQIFMGIVDEKVANELILFFKKSLQCEIMLTQSGLEAIISDKILVSEVLINISCFKHSTLKGAYYPATMDVDLIAENLLQEVVTDRTKLLVMFIACGSFYDQDVLGAIKNKLPNLMICGGRSHPYDMTTKLGMIGDNNGIYYNGLVCVGIDSDILNVQSNYIFGWQDVGLPLTITKAENNIVYEIDHQKAVSILEKYLGKIALKNLMTTTYVFPLIYHVNKIPVARAILELQQDGSVVMHDSIPQGVKVKFGFGSMENVYRETKEIYSEIPDNAEGIYMYSCVSRVMFFGRENLLNVVKIFGDKPMGGFFTFGEIYSNADKSLFLGLTNTFYSLREGEFEKKTFAPRQKDDIILNRDALKMNALSNLMQQVNKDILQLSHEFQSYQQLIDGVMMHIITDAELNILYVNKNLSLISHYSPEDTIGRNCLEFVDIEMRNEIVENILPILKRDGQWSGKVRQYKNDGTQYYVKMIIKSINNAKGEVIKYLIGQLDDTNDELKRIALENDMSFLKKTDEEKKHILDQYQKILDKNQSFFRLDLNRNFIYANDLFLEIVGFNLEDILGRNLYEFIAEAEQWQFLKIGEDLLQKGYYEGVLQYTRRDNKKIYIRSFGCFIKDLNNHPIEIVATGVDITQIINSIKEIETIQKDVIYAMGTICEGKSRETGNHIIRVAEYSALLAKLYGCSREEQELMRVASPMHDIGKVGISDAILNKPGQLTPEEFEIMKTHTTIGRDIFKNSDRLILKTAGEIAGSHHEWWNGEGYPMGMKGEEIPLFGRITALADVFDALSNDRCYKKAWPLDQVLEHIKSLSGKQFQPKLVDLFLDHIDEFLEISKKYQDVA